MRTDKHKGNHLEDKTQHHQTTDSTLCRTPQLNHKEKKNTNLIINTEFPPTQPCPSEEQTNIEKKKNSAQISLYKKLTQTTGPTLEGRNKKEERIQPLSLGKGDLKHDN